MPLAAQPVGVRTGAYVGGFSQSQMMTPATGTRPPQPSQIRLQIAKIISEVAANRVHTLHGFACRCHASSVIPKTPAIFDMMPIPALSRHPTRTCPGLGHNQARPGDYAHSYVRDAHR